MYEAPDRYKRMIAARLPDGESLGPVQWRKRGRKLSAAGRPADFARPARALLRRRQHRRLDHDGRRFVGRGRDDLAGPVVRDRYRRQSRRDEDRPHPGDHPCRPLGPPGAAMGDDRRRRRARRPVAQPPALHVPVAFARQPGDRRVADGRPRHRRARPGRRPALRHGVDVGLHRGRQRRDRCSAATRFRSSTSCRSCSRSGSPSSACSRSPAGRSTSSRPTPTSARRAKAPACCSRNMSSAASAGCGRSMPTTASPTFPRA